MAEQEEIRKKNRSDKTEEKPRTKSSRVWEHFTLDAMKRRVTCKICKNHLAWHGSTTSLSEHLRRKHVGADAEEEHRGQVSRHLEEPARKKQATMDNYMGNKTLTPQQCIPLTNSILNMLVKDMRPLSMVEGAGFQLMLKNYSGLIFCTV
ncbi:E3 SUMO-protein ligase ZBED1-like [Nothobranchius furzeri]|uniref:E3 SUMO-protein ligase ZBED1-like n=1 Tax=Nothobranchius furzeri TaxID=105023 RepID=UPI003904D4E1